MCIRDRETTMNQHPLITNIESLHTTPLGVQRIKRNLQISCDDVAYCRNSILQKQAVIYKQGKNWYCESDGAIWTSNAHSYTIITTHLLQKH